jgi:cell division protein FtsN
MATSRAQPTASGDTGYLYRATIGARAQDYYLRHFARFDGEGRAGTSWNWAAYWSTVNWMIYRRMWGWALAYVAAVAGSALLIFGVGKLVLDYSDTSAILLFLLLLTAAFVVPGLYANAWYYTHVNQKITAVLRNVPEVKDAATVLADGAPGSRRLLWLGAGNAVVLALALAVANWIHDSENALPQMAAHEERLPATSGLLQPRVSAPVARASAPSAVASAPLAQAPTPGAAQAAASVTPAPAQAASAPAAVPAASGAVAVADKSPMVPAIDRSPARFAPVSVATAPVEAAPAPAAAASAAAPRPAPRASAPRAVRHVWVIQVGAYAQESNARNALAQVQALGLDAGAESFDSPKGRLMRVRVGPFTRQAEAEQAALRIKTLNLPVLVIRQRP